MKSETSKVVKDWLQTIVIAVILSLLVKSYVAEARWIPSVSMVPTLQVGDHLIINKVSYEISGIKGVKRGDIVVFNAPPASKLNEVLIKRVIGLPGDTLSIKKGVVYINNSPLHEPYIKGPQADFGPVTVPAGDLFMMGDNRNNSFDSRYWGPLPFKYVIGKADFRYYPFNAFGPLKSN